MSNIAEFFIIDLMRENSNTSKQSIRAQLRLQRQSVSPVECQKTSETVCMKLINARKWDQYNSIHIYEPIKVFSEIDPTLFVNFLRQHFPNMIVRRAGMAADAPIPSEQFDVVVVPVLGYGNKGFRLGMGGGWYDRFLATQSNARKIGLAYRWAKIDNITPEEHDIPLDEIYVA